MPSANRHLVGTETPNASTLAPAGEANLFSRAKFSRDRRVPEGMQYGGGSFHLWRSATDHSGISSSFGGCCLEFAQKVKGYESGSVTVEFAADDPNVELKVESGPFDGARSWFPHRGAVQRGLRQWNLPTPPEGFDRLCIAFLDARETPAEAVVKSLVINGGS